MNKVKTNFGAQMLILSIALIIALPVRMYQYLNVIDPQTGFFTDWFHPTVFGLYGLCALLIILLIALSLKGGKKAIYAMPVGKKKGLGAASVAFALSFLVGAGYNGYRCWLFVTEQVQEQTLVIGDNFGKSTIIFLVVQTVFALLSAAYYIVYAVSCFSGKEQYKKVKLMAAAPAVWCIARMMLGFSQTITYRYVSELLFELLLFVFFGMFAVSFAKFASGLLTSRVQMRIFAYGALSIFFAMLTAVPRYILLLMGQQEVLYSQAELFAATDLVMPIFIGCMLFAIAAEKQYQAVEEYMPE